jgi:hypothetical protein
MHAFKVSDVADAARVINGILAPSLMISACGLLILALQARYSHLIDRIRLLNEERRGLKQVAPPSEVADRIASIRSQVLILLSRAKFVRNSVFALYSAILCFVASSIAIGARLVFGFGPGPAVWLALFLVGMVAVLVGAIYALKDVSSAFTVAQLEVEDLEA